MRKIAVLYGGSYQHHYMFKQSKFAPYFDELIPLRQFADADLSSFDVLIIPSWSHMKILEQNVEKIHAFANEGKIVVTFVLYSFLSFVLHPASVIEPFQNGRNSVIFNQ